MGKVSDGHEPNNAICILFKRFYLDYITKCPAEQMGLEVTLLELADSLHCRNIEEARNLLLLPPNDSDIKCHK